jgi:hypothetical protein
MVRVFASIAAHDSYSRLGPLWRGDCPGALAAGLLLIWVVTWLAYRWYGLLAAGLSGFLLVALALQLWLAQRQIRRTTVIPASHGTMETMSDSIMTGRIAGWAPERQ